MKKRLQQWYDDITSYLTDSKVEYVLDQPDRNFHVDQMNFLMEKHSKNVLAEIREKHNYEVSFNKFTL